MLWSYVCIIENKMNILGHTGLREKCMKIMPKIDIEI